MRPQVGQVVNNKYRLLRLIGDGGMGTVYEARHEVLGTSVALKFLHAELGRRSGLVQRFLQEARVSAQIASPHVVRVTDVDQGPSGAFIVMEYIEGKTLQTLYEELYRAGQQLPQADAIEYAMQMLEGVEAAHRSGIVHRDLKPDNVMITLDGKGRPLIKLLDFGIAKLKASPEFERGLTRPGVIMGTPEYMAPEQAMSADSVDARADIFALGVIIFEMLGGRRPVGGEDPHQIAAAYLSNQIARLVDLAPDVPVPLAEAVHRAIAASPADRWESVSELRDAIQPYAAPPRPPTALPPSPSFVSDVVARTASARAAATRRRPRARAAGAPGDPRTAPSMRAPRSRRPIRQDRRATRPRTRRSLPPCRSPPRAGPRRSAASGAIADPGPRGGRSPGGTLRRSLRRIVRSRTATRARPRRRGLRACTRPMRSPTRATRIRSRRASGPMRSRRSRAPSLRRGPSRAPRARRRSARWARPRRASRVAST
jgi:serine/threonine-protein kinase